jgi:hypothetical protein
MAMGYSDERTLQTLRRVLDIPDLSGEDWDLMFADGERVAEFCDVYERASLTPDERSALMQLIVASYDRKLSDGSIDSTLESRLERFLERDYDLHETTINYWSRRILLPGQQLWAVSPLMRTILDRRNVP